MQLLTLGLRFLVTIWMIAYTVSLYRELVFITHRKTILRPGCNSFFGSHPVVKILLLAAFEYLITSESASAYIAYYQEINYLYELHFEYSIIFLYSVSNLHQVNMH